MDLYRLAEAELRRARLIDSQQTTPRAIEDFTLIEARTRMSRAFVTKTSFTAGELDPLLRGRLDLKAQEDGAARLRNVVVHPSGGVSRRPGLRLVAPCPVRCASSTFEAPTAASSLAFGAVPPRHPRAAARSSMRSPTRCGDRREIADLSAARWGDRLLICHPAVPPKELVRNGVSGWQLRDWSTSSRSTTTASRAACARSRASSAPEIAIHVNDATATKIAAGSFVSLLTSEPVFTPDHIDAVIAVKGKQIRIVNPTRSNRSGRSA